MSKAAQLLGEDLRVKRLNKMWKKNKDDVVDTLDVCGYELLEYYYNEIFHKSERDYRKPFQELMLSPVFLKALKKLVKKKNSDSEYSKEGFAFILTDAMCHAHSQMMSETAKVDQSTMTKEDKEKSKEYINDQYEKLSVLIGEISDALTSRTAKKLRKFGMHKDYADTMAAGLILPEWVTSRNVFRYMKETWEHMYKIQDAGVEHNGANYTSKLGLGLEDPKNIAKIMKNICLKDANKDVLMNVVINGALDAKGRFYLQILNNAQRACYDAITYYILELMNSDIFTKGDRIKIIKDVARKRLESRKGGYDDERRIMFSKVKDITDTDGNAMFPKVVKAWNQYSEKSEE